MRQAIEPSASERVADWIRHVADRTGKRTLDEQAAALGVTKQSLSRWKRGAGLPSLTQLHKILDQADVPEKTRTAVLALRERADQERRQRHDGVVPPPPPPVAARSWWARRRKIVAPAVLAAVLMVGVLVGVLIAEGNPVSATCDHYEVTAETLYRRDADGTPLDFLHNGERLDVVSRQDGKYWYVATSDGKTGWILPDPRWIRPRC